MSGHRTARVLVYTHRWLGIVGGILFIVWFVSGVVMMYARMPALGSAERLARLPTIDASSIRVLPAGADEVTRLQLTTIEGRPAFRVTAKGRTQSVFADTGEKVPLVSAEEAAKIARAFDGGAHEVRYEARLTDADQWSFGVRGRMPLHRLTVDDGQGTEIYVAENGGDVVLKTTFSGRFWGGAGAVLHWIYFTPFRRQGALWDESIVWLSIAGTLMCIVGIVWGLWRFAPVREYRLRDHQQWSPYAGWMRWHHYAGLIFGLVTTTWIFSGLLSMDPWDWHPSTAPTRDQRQHVSGGPLAIQDLSIDRVRRGVTAFGGVKELDYVRFGGNYYAVAAAGLIQLREDSSVADQLPHDAIAKAAIDAMPGIAVEDQQWLAEYDAYYYDRDRQLALPVLRARFLDPQRTWLYLDPRRGTIVRKEERLTRLNRWLYHGFHSLDFPFLYYRRPLWDIVVIVLSIGGIVLSVTTISAAWKRVKRTVTSVSRS